MAVGVLNCLNRSSIATEKAREEKSKFGLRRPDRQFYERIVAGFLINGLYPRAESIYSAPTIGLITTEKVTIKKIYVVIQNVC